MEALSLVLESRWSDDFGVAIEMVRSVIYRSTLFAVVVVAEMVLPVVAVFVVVVAIVANDSNANYAMQSLDHYSIVMSTSPNPPASIDRKNVFSPTCHRRQAIAIAMTADDQTTTMTMQYYRSIQNDVRYCYPNWAPMYRTTNWNVQPNDSTNRIDYIQPSDVVIASIALLAVQTECPRIDLSCLLRCHRNMVDFVLFAVNVDRVFVVVMMTMTKDQMMKLN